jgi:hypothetical protein
MAQTVGGADRMLCQRIFSVKVTEKIIRRFLGFLLGEIHYN